MFVAFAGSLSTMRIASAPRGGPVATALPPAAGPPSVLDRARATYRAVLEAGKALEMGPMFGPEANAFVARVQLGGKQRVYVGIKVPQKVVQEGVVTVPQLEAWAKQELLLPGEELGGISVSSGLHIDEVVMNKIAADARSARIPLENVTGEAAAGTPVCENCQAHGANLLKNLTFANPKPKAQ
jgi:hypothetical protein